MKSGYHYWYNLNFGNVAIPQSIGWKKVWNLKLPHKLKVFIWRFCRNAVPVRKRLSSKGIRLSTTCHMCLLDIEHKSQLFYYCEFVVGCWDHVRLWYDWSRLENDTGYWVSLTLHLLRNYQKFVLSYGVFGTGETRRYGMRKLLLLRLLWILALKYTQNGSMKNNVK